MHVEKFVNAENRTKLYKGITAQICMNKHAGQIWLNFWVVQIKYVHVKTLIYITYMESKAGMSIESDERYNTGLTILNDKEYGTQNTLSY